MHGLTLFNEKDHKQIRFFECPLFNVSKREAFEHPSRVAIPCKFKLSLNELKSVQVTKMKTTFDEQVPV